MTLLDMSPRCLTRRLGLLILMSGTGLMIGCVDQTVTSPGLEDGGGTLQARADALGGPGAASLEAGTDNYLILFRGRGEPAELRSAVQGGGGEVVAVHEGVGLALVHGLDQATAAELARARWVQALAPEATFDLELPLGVGEVLAAPLGDQILGGPEDALFFARQWHLRVIGADRAWEAGHTGSPAVTVAILDTGIGYLHPDVAGLVDLDRSVSFVPGDEPFRQAFRPDAHPSVDLNLHGTHVAATVASNAVLAAGVTARTTLMSVKVCNVFGECPVGAVLMGVLHAADHGADVINLSLGGGFLKAGSGGFHSIINEIFTYAGRQGSLVVAAAGNDAFNMNQVPAAFFTYCDAPHVVCVSATGPVASAGINGPWAEVDTPAWYTNFGRGTIDVAAPGGTAPGLVYAACNPLTLLSAYQVCTSGSFVVGLGGTSQAAPHVSGLAALLVAEHGQGQPAFIRNRILQSAEQMGHSSRDQFYGRGRIDAAGALGLH